MLNEINQTQNHRYYLKLFIYIGFLEQAKSQRQKIGQKLLEDERGNGELLFNEYRISIWDDEKFLEIHSSDGYTTL